MQVQSISLLHSRSQFTVTLDENEVGKYFERAVSQLTPTVKIQGFRPGRAPRELIRQNLDETKLREAAYGLAVRESWRQIGRQLAVGERQQSIPIQEPEVSLEKFEEAQTAKIVFEFDIQPQVKVGSWKKIKLPIQTYQTVSEEEVGDLFETLSRATAKTIHKLTPAKLGDKLHVSFEGSIDGARQAKLSSKNFPLILGQDETIPGFGEQLLGLKKGAKKHFQLRFPAQHFEKSLAGQLADFELEVGEVFDIILPELNKAFAEKFGHSSVQKLKQAIRADIAQRKTEERFVTQKAKWLAEFENLVTVDAPISLVEAEVARSRAVWRKFLRERNLIEGEWLKSRQLTLEQLEKDWRRAAKSSVTIGLGLAEVAKELNKELKSNEEFQALLDELVKGAIT